MKTRVFYLRDENQFPVACVASKMEGENKVVFAYSVHNLKDEFDKQRGRQIAEGRLAKGHLVYHVEFLAGQVKRRIIERIANGVAFPTKASAAARLWLKLQSQPD